jgi:hypothetical protein
MPLLSNPKPPALPGQLTPAWQSGPPSSAGKAVLWTDAELVERDVLACLVDAALQTSARSSWPVLVVTNPKFNRFSRGR